MRADTEESSLLSSAIKLGVNESVIIFFAAVEKVYYAAFFGTSTIVGRTNMFSQ
jgi:hypothetical protein